ncbi:D-glycero-beta-D-manno-heptose 1-phosphate adenylyltransferase [Bacteroidota bacterium]
MTTQEQIKSKIRNISDATEIINQWKKEKQKIVFSNGCFDIIHKGHIDYLAKAADLGNRLVLGLNTDNSVEKLKGRGRPVQDENSRSLILASLIFIDMVILFNEETPYQLIKTIQPHILVKGKDYSPESIVGYDIIKASGGEIITIDLVEGYSTSSIIKKISDLNK